MVTTRCNINGFFWRLIPGLAVYFNDREYNLTMAQPKEFEFVWSN